LDGVIVDVREIVFEKETEDVSEAEILAEDEAEFVTLIEEV
jgi:hypothetical protein